MPLAGSYYVESLTDRIEADARALIEEVDAIGGAAKAIGVNRFTVEEPPPRMRFLPWKLRREARDP